MAYVVSARWRSKPGREARLAELCDEMTESSRGEPGNLFYQGHRSPEDPQLFYIYEQYVDEAGFRAHQDTEHFTRLVKGEAIPELLDDRGLEIFETL
jgi:quinol monooxygenase YgiN